MGDYTQKIKKRKNKTFCGSKLCRKTDRRYKCKICYVWCCGLCVVNYKNNCYCIDCYIENYAYQDIKEEFKKQIKDLFGVK